MKNVCKFLFLMAVLLAGPNYVQAQCNPFYNFQEGSLWELTSYNAHDKKTGRQASEVKSLEENSSGWKAVIAFQYFDEKDKLVIEDEGELVCIDGVIQMDMERFIPKESLEALKGMDLKFEVDNLQWPSELSVGKQLDDAAVKISSDFFNMRIAVTDRRVEGKEKVTTPSGTFDAFKISSTVKTKMMMDMEIKSVNYIAEDVGIVKSETYDVNGKMTGYTLLTRYE